MPVEPEVLALYRSGVTNVVDLTRGWTEDDWAQPACGLWTGADLAGHLVTVIGWYHDWLDRGLAGEVTPRFGIDELDAQTASALAGLPLGDGPSRMTRFSSEADRYADRLIEHWDAPFAYPRGLVIAGLHAGVAATEWHLHAWDFAQARGEVYEPEHAERLYTATAACLMAATGGIRGRIGMRVAARIANRNAWPDLLRRSGRT